MSDDTTKDHPNQAVDTPVPDGEWVNEEAWAAMQAADAEPDDEVNANG